MESETLNAIGWTMMAAPFVVLGLIMAGTELAREHDRGTLKKSLVSCGWCGCFTALILVYAGITASLIHIKKGNKELPQIEKSESK